MSEAIRLAEGLAMPLDAVTRTFGIFGQRGSGKSSTAAVFVEQGVRVGGRFVIADPTGVWWGLMHDGKGPGLPGIVFGGEHGDVPLERTAGHVVADFVVQQDQYPVVVLDLKLHRKAARHQFMADFLETLYHDNREALHIVLDESSQFAPTNVREGGDVIRLLGAVEDVISLGRARGIGATMISQRFATLNANVREQIETLVAHRLVGSLDRKALKGWIEANGDPAREKEVLDLIAKLKTGRALVWSPAFLNYFGVVDLNAPTTFDSRATPKVGQRLKKPGKRAPIDLDLLRERMAETIEEAQANDPKWLRKRVADLERLTLSQAEEIDAFEATAAATAVLEMPVEIRVPIFPAELGAALRERFDGLILSLGHTAEDIQGMSEQVAQAMEVESDSVVAQSPTWSVVRESALAHVAETCDIVEAANSRYREYDLTSSEQRVLDALAWFEALNIARPSRIQTGFVAGYKVGKKGGGTFAQVLANMGKAGLIEFPRPGHVSLTGLGRPLAVDPGLPRTNDAMHAAVLARLSEPQARILRVLLDVHSDAISRPELGAKTGYTVTAKGGGTFAQLLADLKTLALIDYPSRGLVVASDILFPMSR